MRCSLCEEKRFNEIPARVRRVNRLLAAQIDPDGLHRTRSAKTQIRLLVELTSLKHALRRYHEQYADEFDAVIDRMHRGLNSTSLGTGEPAYFNGTGQLPHDVLVALQAQSLARMRDTGRAGGYGRLVAGPRSSLPTPAPFPHPNTPAMRTRAR